MLVLLLVIGAFVGFRALNREELEVEPERVDYLAAVEAAQSGDWQVAYPRRCRPGWRATSIDAAAGVDWGDRLPDPGRLRRRPAVRELAAASCSGPTSTRRPGRCRRSSPGATSAVGGRRTRTPSGDLAYASEVDGQTLLVFGSAPESDLLALAERLTTEPVAGR